jgi:SAM-dependent methyltransferase
MAPPGGGERHWFEPVADHLGAAYLRYSFTKGTDREVAFLVEALGLRPGQRVLDVGCGPGRHAHALARLGVEVVGVDVSRRFVDLATAGAPPGATFVLGDARDLPFDAEFDAALSLCEGAFGLQGGPAAAAHGGDPLPGDQAVLAGMARAVRPGGAVVVGAFSAYFQVRHLDDPGSFDAATGVHHERTVVKDEGGRDAEHDLWTTTYTPRELRLMAAAAGLAVRSVWSVEPGAYGPAAPGLETPEFLLIAERPQQGGW